MHKRWWVVVGALAGMVLAGCEKSESPRAGGTVDAALVGTWRMATLSVNGGPVFVPGTWTLTMEFAADGRARFSGVAPGEGAYSDGGTWGVQGTTLTAAIEDWPRWSGAYRIEGNTLHWTVPDYGNAGEDGVFTFARQ